MTIELSGVQRELLDAVGVGRAVKEIQQRLNEKRAIVQGQRFEPLDMTVIAPNLDSLIEKGVITRHKHYGEAHYFPTFNGYSLLQSISSVRVDHVT